MSHRRRISFVGIGPGNPKYLTLAAAEAISEADLILAPPGVPQNLLEYCSADQKVVGGASAAELIRQHAPTSARIVRLVWGSPALVEGIREEWDAATEAGMVCSAIPGVPLATAGLVTAGADPAGAGEMCVLSVSGNPLAATTELVSWITAGATVLIQGSREDLADLFAALVEEGHGDTPSVVVRQVALPRQTATDLPVAKQLEESPSDAGPQVAVVGKGVTKDEALSWFERRPLHGRRVLVTRPRDQAKDFVEGLERLGADVVSLPTIQIVAPEDPEPLLDAARRSNTFDWIVFTSVNGVRRFWTALQEVGLDTRALGGVRICAIGPATGAAVVEAGAGVDLMPEEYVAEAVIESMNASLNLQGARILLPRADIARDVLPVSLANLGAHVEEVAAYRTVPAADAIAELRSIMETEGFDLLTFTSSSTVRNFAMHVGTQLGECKVASIGPITSGTAAEFGWSVDIEATEHTTAGMLDAIEQHYRSTRS